MSELRQIIDLAAKKIIQGEILLDQFLTKQDLKTALPHLKRTELVTLHKLMFSDIKTREDILSLEKYIEELEEAYKECPYEIFHSFADGMYTREIHINKGDFIVGAIHRKDYFINVLKGRIWVVSEFGAKEVIAPTSFTAKAGVKHIGFTLEDTVWSDTHKVESTNIKDAENEIFADNYDSYDEYRNVLKDLNFTEDQVKEISEIRRDIIPQPKKDMIEVKRSSIEGLGVFAVGEFVKGEHIGTARIADKRTYIGRYANHSDNPNAGCGIEADRGYIYALTNINHGEEITIDYRESRNSASEMDRSKLCQVG